ncbi:MAG: flagellar biosynthetic protein FliO [Asticcacaulis sp.]|uniref:FliO/MopB family protein n=1 Tax=Asticcacaulis sp. TaxID=1872648 RepID=UPI0039E41035
MSLVEILRAFFGLSIVIGLILGLAFVLRRYAPSLMAKLQAQRGARRLEVIETLVLDPARRLVLVRFDDKERLVLLGEGRELDAQGLPGKSAVNASSVKTSVDPNDDLF